MFFEDVLYPEYEPSMKRYREEAQKLSKFMENEYKISYPGTRFDDRGLLRLPLGNRWMKGEEYAFLLRHYKTYQAVAGFSVNDRKQEKRVYDQPVSK